MKMIEALNSFLADNMLWVSLVVLIATVVLIARSIFSTRRKAEREEFIDAEYLMEDDDAFVPPNDA